MAPYAAVMERLRRQAAPSRAPGDTGGDNPAIRDAAEIVSRAATDEAAADRARDEYLARAMPSLAPDGRIAPLLGPDEHVWPCAVRWSWTGAGHRPDRAVPRALWATST